MLVIHKSPHSPMLITACKLRCCWCALNRTQPRRMQSYHYSLLDWVKVRDGGTVLEVLQDHFFGDELVRVLYCDIAVRHTAEDLLAWTREKQRHNAIWGRLGRWYSLRVTFFLLLICFPGRVCLRRLRHGSLCFHGSFIAIATFTRARKGAVTVISFPNPIPKRGGLGTSLPHNPLGLKAYQGSLY